MSTNEQKTGPANFASVIGRPVQCLFAASLLGMASPTLADATGSPSLQVVSEETGSILVRVLSDESRGTFPEGTAVLQLTGKLRAGSVMRINVDHLPDGQYAVAVFQDINGNGSLDNNLLGVPTEPFGFSNNAAGSFGPPDFDAAAITVSSGRLALTPRIKIGR